MILYAAKLSVPGNRAVIEPRRTLKENADGNNLDVLVRPLFVSAP